MLFTRGQQNGLGQSGSLVATPFGVKCQNPLLPKILVRGAHVVIRSERVFSTPVSGPLSLRPRRKGESEFHFGANSGDNVSVWHSSRAFRDDQSLTQKLTQSTAFR